MLNQTKAFLHSLALDYDDGVEFTVNLIENEEIHATGSRQGNVLKCIGVSAEDRGRGYAAKIVTELVKNAVQEGFSHLFLFTKPKNSALFGGLGFYPVAATQDVLLMENIRHGVQTFVEGLECPTKQGAIGCIVANCNPFTNGHLYLVEAAAHSCDLLHLFILSEDRSMFPADVRLELAKRAVAHLHNVVVHPTGDYLISYATFPSYFIKDKTRVGEINGALDLAIFAQQFAKPLNITQRFVGTEPFSPVTDSYNRTMESYLPSQGINVVVVPRLKKDGAAVSASRVRALLAQGKLEEIRGLVPPVTYDYLERLDLHDMC